MIKDIEGLKNKIANEIQKEVDIAVIGLSGGVDSALTACLCVEALGKENVIGVHMPYGEVDTSTFNLSSRAVANDLGIKQMSVPIGIIANCINSSVQDAIKRLNGDNLSILNKGNARSRARMAILYGIAHHYNEVLNRKVRVIGTGNLSEDYIGYDTKGGDALCDIFPIGSLLKSEIYQLVETYKDILISKEVLEPIIQRAPSAGLWEGQTDEQELEYTYEQMEPAIKQLLVFQDKELSAVVGHAALSDVERYVAKRHLTNSHKHEAPKVITVREFCD